MSTTKKTLRAVCPIFGLGWIVSDLQIQGDTVLRFIDLLKKENDELAAVGLRAVSYKCVLEITREFDPKDYSVDPWFEIQALALDVEAALRIYHPGKIGVAAVIYYETTSANRQGFLIVQYPTGRKTTK